ncbi:hypothetical protein A2Z22_03185 [Candidatus Woesebacteria bacterium RBG_16_34_12]|uniref:Uncharacterized protein n=1 Tax=Candidatus Woesebacteria bacterium RBG_16_34_12 TaxID=1802480 RepID=A0A1F7XAM3_9BACT|nr:MAG: hypothetical protein A2Z22_03185 [Candidatus Woesebacteria bacterium RBG_16_34_12]
MEFGLEGNQNFDLRKIDNFGPELLQMPKDAVLVRVGDARDLLGIFGQLEHPFFDPETPQEHIEHIYAKPSITPEERLIHAWVVPENFPRRKLPKGFRLDSRYDFNNAVYESLSYASTSPERRNTLYFFNELVLDIPFVNDPLSLPPADDVLFAVRLPLKEIKPEHLSGIYPASDEGRSLLRLILPNHIQIPKLPKKISSNF